MSPHQATFQLKWDLRPENGSLSRQLSDQIRDSITTGELTPGDRIPPTRRLAEDLGIARGTVSTAIELLIAEGIMEARIGSGTYVAEDAAMLGKPIPGSGRVEIPLPNFIPKPDIDSVGNAKVDFRPCRPSLEAFPLQIWRRCMSAASSTIPHSDYGDPRGHHGLKVSIQNYLRRARGLQFETDEIIITNGAVHAMQILSALYLDNESCVVYENPGYPLARQTFSLSGAKIRDCGVDEDGLILDALPKAAKGVRFIYVTPSHQYPTGGRLSLSRRRSLIEWANRHGALIIEDDYDGEFRYDVPPLAPLATMSPSSVVYCGTFSKTMFPGLRIGFAVAPKQVIEAMAAYRTISEYAPNTQTQIALANFISGGHYEKHIHRMRRIYSAKRKQVAQSLSETGYPAILTGLDSGLSVNITLNSGMEASILSEKARTAGVLVPSVKRYDFSGSLADDSLILGYAEPSLTDIDTGIRTLFGK